MLPAIIIHVFIGMSLRVLTASQVAQLQEIRPVGFEQWKLVFVKSWFISWNLFCWNKQGMSNVVSGRRF